MNKRQSRLGHMAVPTLLGCLFVLGQRALPADNPPPANLQPPPHTTRARVSGLSTGIPIQFNIDPATIRQGEKDESAVVATVVLKVASPTFFVCQIRSGDKNKITFANIVFRKGQSKGTAAGAVHWLRVLTEDEVKVSAFSVDAPEEKLWFTVALKPREQDETQPANGPNQPGNEQPHGPGNR